MTGPWEDFAAPTAPTAPAKGEVKGPWEDYGGKTPGLSGGTKPDPITAGLKPYNAGEAKIEGFKAAGAAVAKEVGGFLDMFVDSATAAIPSGINAASNWLGDTLRGTPHTSERAAELRKEYQDIREHWSPHMFSKLADALTPAGHEVGETRAQSVLNQLMKVSDSSLDAIQGQSNGVLKADDLKTLRDFVLDAAGAKATARVGKAAVDTAGKPGAPKPEEPPPEKPTPETKPADQAKRDIERTMGIKDPKAQAADIKARRNDARQAFKEDPQWADYLRNTAEYEANARAAVREESARLTPEQMAERTRPGEKTAVDEAPRVLEQNPFGDLAAKAPSALESGLAKSARGRAFDMTAEERLAVNKSGSAWDRPAFLGEDGKPLSKEAGKANDKLLLGLATLGVGGVLGANLDKDNPIIGALLGMVGAAGARRIGTEGAGKMGRAVVDGKPARAATQIGAGAAAGYALSDDNDRLSGAALGALAVAAARALPKDTRLRIGTEANARDYLEQSFNLQAHRLQYAILDKVKDPERLKAIWKANEPGGSVAGLSVAEREVSQAFKTYYENMDAAAKRAGVYKEGLDNYMARVHDLDPKDVEFELQKLFQKTGKSGGNPFSKERKFLTLEDAKAAGYTPKTENPVEMLGIYAHSMGKAIADRNLVNGLMEKPVPLENTPKGSERAKFVMPEKDAPRSYVSVDSAAMRGKRVHPDLEQSMRFLFEARNPSTAMRALETLNAATKRVAVMMSLFHAKSLLDAAVGAAKVNKSYLVGGAGLGGLAGLTFGDPATGAQIGAGLGMLASMGKTGMLAARGTLSYLEKLKRGGQGGIIDRAMKGGLEITMEKHPSIVDDQGGGTFYAGMEDAAKLLNTTVKGAGKPIEGLIKLNQIFDNFMWARLHTGLKLSVFDEKFNQIKENNARAAEKAPDKVKLLTEDEIAHIAGSFTNDTFGGLNWRRIAEGAKGRFSRDLAESTLSPKGRKAMQLLMFAPDWTISTTRAFTGAFGEGSGLKGLMKPRELADLHRQYVLRSAFFYALAGDGINYTMSGHHIWDNKDPTRLELGDGRTMQFSKHMMEPYHWMMHPVQQGLNKLSWAVKEPLNQALGTEYLAPRKTKQGTVVAGPAMKSSRLRHFVQSASPIASQQSTNSGAVGGAAGFLGFPIYGQTAEQREDEKRRRRLEQLMQEPRK